MEEKEILNKINKWKKDKVEVALATVINTWGSSPRPVGSIMAINSKNEIIGSVSGGCVEAAVFSEAINILKNKKPKILEFGITNKEAWEVGLTCGGKLQVYVEKVF